jgi:hypothetical protein
LALDRAGSQFRKGLRAKGVQDAPGVFDMTCAPDGWATFGYWVKMDRVCWLDPGGRRLRRVTAASQTDVLGGFAESGEVMRTSWFCAGFCRCRDESRQIVQRL